MKSLIDNGVDVGGRQTITGHKRIANKGDTPFVKYGQQNSQLDIQAINIDSSNLPSSSNVYGGITFTDKNDLRIGKVETSLTSSGVVQTVLSVSKLIGTTYTYASIGASVTADGKKIYNFGQGGNTSSYLKIPLGGSSNKFLTISWGLCTPGSSSAGSTVNFAVAYDSMPRVQVTLVNGGDAGYCAYVWSRSKTGFSAARHGGTGSADWIAIGISN